MKLGARTFASVAKDIGIAILLTAPVFVYYAAHFLHRPPGGGDPTGFILYDMPYYVSNARGYLEQGFTHLLYANPFDYDLSSPKIYFQPLIYLLGLLLAIHPSTPAVPFVLICFTAAVASFYLLRKFLRALYPDFGGGLRFVTDISVAWGGGLLAVMGIAQSIRYGIAINPYLYDPFEGMWFLNLGRNFIFSTEAFYHLIAIGILWSALMRKRRLGYILLWLIVLSHPFTGLQFAVIAFVWVLFERQFMDSAEFSWKDVILAALPLVLAIAYYLIILPRFPSHQSLMRQWTLAWTLDLPAMLGGYGIVAALVVFRCRTKERFIRCFSQPFSRFLAVMFLVSFVLANHEFFLQPRQPIHFTRGYIWTPLALLGLPVLAGIWRRLRNSRFLLITFSIGWLLLFTSDNLIFFSVEAQEPQGVYLTQDQKSALHDLDSLGPEPLLISDNLMLAYMATVYSSARPLVGHWANTPDAVQRFAMQDTLFKAGHISEPLRKTRFYVLSESHQSQLRADARCKEIRTYGKIGLFEFPAGSSSR